MNYRMVPKQSYHSKRTVEKKMAQQMALINNDQMGFLAFLKDMSNFANRCSPCENSDIKKRMESFTTIFAESKNQDHFKAYISKTCNVITKIYSKLSEYFHQYEPEYVQKFHWRWMEILDCIDLSSLAKSCERYIRQINTLVGRLMTAATHRLEQIPILSVLMRYTQHIHPDADVSNEFDNDIVVEIARKAKDQSGTVIHTLLNYMNSNGENIFTIRPTKTASIDFELDCLEQKQNVWLDFNLKINSVTFIVLSTRTKELLCLGIVFSPRIQHYLLHGEFLLSIRGRWTLSHGGVTEQLGQRSEFMFTCKVDVKVKIDSLKSVFDISEYLNYDDTKTLQDADLESVGSTTIFFQDSVVDDDERSRKTLEENFSPDRLSPELASDDDCWKQFLNRLDVISTENENFNQSSGTSGSVAVNYGSNENRPTTSKTCTVQQMETIFEETTTGQTDLNRITTRRCSKFIVQKTVNKDGTKTSRKVFESMYCESRDVRTSRTNNDAETGEPPRKRTRFNVEPVEISPCNTEPPISQVGIVDISELHRRIVELECRVENLTRLIERNVISKVRKPLMQNRKRSDH